MSDEECDCEEGAPAWMATFSDLATLLLTFFVLLLSFADLNVVHFKQMLGSVREAFGVQFVTHGSHEALSSSPISLDGRQPPANEAAADATEEEIEERAEEMGLGGEIEVDADEGGLTVRIRERVLFASGSADLDSEVAGDILRMVLELGSTISNELAIHGHTDDRPIRNARYPSNWELSAARASSVVRYLSGESLLEGMSISIAGYADTRPVLPNDSDEHRAANRRVEFRFVRHAPPPEATGVADPSANEASAASAAPGEGGAPTPAQGASAGIGIAAADALPTNDPAEAVGTAEAQTPTAESGEAPQ